MTITSSYRAFVFDQLSQVVTVTTRPMFGGLTFFHEGRAFALIAEDRLYFKVDDTNRCDFEAAGMGPFLPFGDPEKTMAYYELPEDVLEDLDELRGWVTKSLAVATRAAKHKSKQRKSRNR